MRDERGITLVELIIYAMLSVLILSIVGGMLVNSLTAERIVRDSSQASNTGQLVAQSVTRGVRMASKLEVSTPTPDSVVMRALIVDDALASPATAHCEAWYFGNGELRTTRSPSAIPIPGSHADAEGWTLLATGVAEVGARPAFSVTGLSANLALELDTGDSSPLLIETSAVSRQQAPPTEVATLCF
ncbi:MULTISPECIES: type II secretion system protein J [unclassified Cryobacterium]|uniref:PulJ/GspJ family protein n=1 Tax=unclassified Cryobacterium TaxID=2649013 RepID=UPI001445B545|nr:MULTISPECIES: hypothetical protein [unclassified Cryobacterium]